MTNDISNLQFLPEPASPLSVMCNETCDSTTCGGSNGCSVNNSCG